MLTMNDGVSLAKNTIALVRDSGFLSEVAQLRALASLQNLGIDTTHIRWSFERRRLQRNATAGIFGVESLALLSPETITDSEDLKTAALRLAQVWEALAVAAPDEAATALITSAIGYEIAGYQANSATIGERLATEGLKWSMAPMVIDFLRRRLVAVVTEFDKLKSIDLTIPDVLTLVTAAGDRLLGTGLAAASMYLLGGHERNLEEASALLERARSAYSKAGRFQEANICFAAAALLPIIRQRTTWNVISQYSPTWRWNRYLKLAGRGTSGRVVDARSLSELWPSQIAALQSGLLSSRESMVLRLPTSAGKTRIAEIAIAHQLCTDPASRCLYVAPYRALVSEIEDNFINLFSDLGLTVASFVGAYDDDAFEQQMASDSNLLIATPERLDLLERISPEFFEKVQLVILDESQLFGDSSRGARYELLLSRLRIRLPTARFVVMSAVVPDQTLDDFASWLRSPASSIVRSDWRPSVQRVSRFLWQGDVGVIRYEASDDLEFRGAFLHGIVRRREFEHIYPGTGRTRRPKFPDVSNKSQTSAELALHFSRLGPVLVFCPQTNFAEFTAEALSRRLDLSLLVGEDIPSRFAERDRPSARVAEEWLGRDHRIARLLRKGIGVHHGRLPDAVRLAIESDFRSRELSVLMATTTLAQGVNLPVRTVIVHSCYRSDGERRERLSEREYWNIAGRAGRAGFETEGTIVHLVFNPRDDRDFRYYQDRRDSMDPIESVLFRILLALRQERISSDQVARFLNPELLALMTEESLDAFDDTVSGVLSQSLVSTQASRFRMSVEPLAEVMTSEANRIRGQIPGGNALSAFRATGLSSDSCVGISSVLAAETDILEMLQTLTGQVPRELVELLLRVMSAAPEFALDDEPPVDYVEATVLWLQGESVAEIERQLLGDIESARQFGSFASGFFVHTLPWAASVMLALAKQQLDLTDAELSLSARSLPSMIRFGVPTPEAAWCMSIGVGNRRASVKIAAEFRASGALGNHRSFREWLATVEIPLLRERYEISGLALKMAIRAISQMGAASLTDQSFDVARMFPLKVTVVGTQYEARWAVSQLVSEGDRVTLRREIDNAYDRNAILVIWNGSELGYISRRYAQLIAPEIDAGLHVHADVLEIDRENISVQLRTTTSS